MNATTNRWVVGVALGTFLAFAGCTGESDVGKVTVLIRDGSHGAPLAGDIDTWVVTISRVEIRAEDADDDGQMDEEDDGSWIVLRDDPVEVDLADLPSQMEMIVEGAVVPSGTYGQLRFVIDGGYLVIDEGVFATADAEVPIGLGEPGELRMPSMGTSGLKVKLPEGATVQGDAHVLVLDFDLSQSLGHDAAADVWVMHPVVEATDWLVTGTISVFVDVSEGVMMPPGTTLESFAVDLVGAGGQAVARVTLVDLDADGTAVATFRFVDPRLGPFSVRLVPPEDVTVQTEPTETIDLDSGEAVAVSIELTSVQQE